jgi:hypothetical protein
MTRSVGAERAIASSELQAAEKRKRLRQRNWALMAALVGFVVLVYVITIVKMKGA